MPAIDPTKVAVYIRWSTEDQGHGHTLAIQSDACRYYCLSQGWSVGDDRIYIDDGYSGGSLDRPALARLRRDVAAQTIQAVVVYKLDRLSRNVRDIIGLALDEWEGRCAIRSTMEPIDTASDSGKLLFTLLSSFADFERGTIRSRTLSGKRKNAEQGRNAGMPYPYGYERADEAGSYRIVESEAAVVRLIFDLYVRGTGCKVIADQLNNMGILTRLDGPGRPRLTPGKWSNSAVQRVLRNRIYVGDLVYNRNRRNPRAGREGEPYYLKNSPETVIQVSSRHIPPIIEADLFAQAEQVRASKRAPNLAKRAINSPHLLSGILWCTACGHALVGRKSPGKTGKYYYCSGHKNKGPGVCQAAMIRADVLDEAVWRLLEDVYGEPVMERSRLAWREQVAGERDMQVQLLRDTEQKVRVERQAQERLLEDYRRGVVKGEAYQRIYDSLAGRLRDLEKARLALTQELDSLNREDGAFEERAKAYVALRKGFGDMSDAERKVLFRCLVNRITAYRTRGQKEFTINIDYAGEKGVTRSDSVPISAPLAGAAGGKPQTMAANRA